MGEGQGRSDRRLLIVDDNQAILRSLCRLCGLHFSEVYAASTPEQAETILRDQKPSVLLCDYWLGYNYPLATELIRDWRRRFPCLKKVALMTGSSVLEDSDAVDATFCKPLHATEVMSFLKTA